MKLADVLRKERERAGLSIETTASELGLSVHEYQQIEAGDSETEKWGPILAAIAIELETPISSLLARSGKANDVRHGSAGQLIKEHRERRHSMEQMANTLGLPVDVYITIEEGAAPIEKVGSWLLRFAEITHQPAFNLLYPHGLPLNVIADYP